MKVRHFGNTANNAFYNAVLLKRFAGIESQLPIGMFGLYHGISAPSWEVVDFDVPSAEWVSQPDWSAFPEAVAVNAEYTDLPAPSTDGGDTGALSSDYRSPNVLPGLRRWVNASLNGKAWAQPLFDYRTRQQLARRTEIDQPEGRINILYGADSLTHVKAQASGPTVCVEHGTIRWIGDGSATQKLLRRVYREQVQQARHLWVTNLDPRTLEIAEDLVPGRWSVLPHPWVPDSRVPFPETPRRQELLQQSGSESLVLLPSSQNWAKHHDKGSMKALRAFVELRRAGRDVGLVAVEWGLQLAESKAFLEQAGVAANVAWVPPMARFSLQRTMANVDVVWDQFGLEAFGGLAMRAMEQGTPLISRGLAPIGERLIGGPVPWRHAATTEDIVAETGAVLDEIALQGRGRVIEHYRARYRSWLLERHDSRITAALQREVYTGILDGSWEPGAAVPGRWAQLLSEGLGEDGSSR